MTFEWLDRLLFFLPARAKRTAAAEKRLLRTRMKQALEVQEAGVIREKSAAIRRKLFGSEVFRSARNVCFYVSLPQEVDTTRMIDEALALGKKVCVPRVDRQRGEIRFYEI